MHSLKSADLVYRLCFCIIQDDVIYHLLWSSFFNFSSSSCFSFFINTSPASQSFEMNILHLMAKICSKSSKYSHQKKWQTRDIRLRQKCGHMLYAESKLRLPMMSTLGKSSKTSKALSSIFVMTWMNGKQYSIHSWHALMTTWLALSRPSPTMKYALQSLRTKPWSLRQRRRQSAKWRSLDGGQQKLWLVQQYWWPAY